MCRVTSVELEDNAEPGARSQRKDRNQDMEELHQDVLSHHIGTRVTGLIRGHSFASERSDSDAIHGCLRRTLLQLRLVGIA